MSKELAVIKNDVMEISKTQFQLINTVFNIQLIQPGKVKDNKSLAPHVCKFYMEGLEESFDKLEMLPISILGHSRKYHTPFDSKERELLCSSRDGEVPSPKIESPFSDRCGEVSTVNNRRMFTPICEKAKWKDKNPPICGEEITAAFLAFLNINGKPVTAPVKMVFKGTGITAYNRAQKEFEKKVVVAAWKGKSMTDYRFLFSAENEGTYARLKMEFIEVENAPNLKPLIDWYATNVFAKVQAVDEEANVKVSDVEVNLPDEENSEGKEFQI